MGDSLVTEVTAVRRALHDLSRPLYVLKMDDGWAVGQDGIATFGGEPPSRGSLQILAHVPALQLHQLGDPSFCADYGIRFPYMTGAMANGIASADLVIAVARAGMLGSFGAAGLR